MSKAAKSPAGKSEQKSSTPSYQVDKKGLELMAEANKRMNKSSLMSIFGGSTQKYEEGRELIQKAAAQFKISKNWQEAGDAYAKSAEIADKNLKESFEAAQDYINAAKAYKNVNTELAIQNYQYAINIQMENNKFSPAARLWKELAEIQEKELQLEAAAFAYQKAADCFEAEDAKANAAGCHIKVAELAAEQEDYKKAIEIYEKVSNASLDNTGMRWSVKDYLFKALLCQFILSAKSSKQDMKLMEDTVERYIDMLPQLKDTRELKLIQDAVQAFKDDDVEAFTDHVFRYDEIYKLDNWTAKILLDVKTALKDGPQQKNMDFTGAKPESDDFT